ncbi:aminomethyl-transferring glycine dehydrogenase subunit GcvPA [Christensenellaceae bacterium OttesenSCG-928-L17]|nr:aminomethyl-transferring glycine dehydrogenase subunit GcvPA [Christensenellaceae bacterium OttesenSCG-928-L17]
MRSYIPNTKAEQADMLCAIGLSAMEDLFADIPADVRLNRPLRLAAGMSEAELRRYFENYNTAMGKLPLFRGAGAYRHTIPAVIGALLSRAEFYTAYTPYQAEMSQGMLQSIFEYQTLICDLLGMDASNASVYDGATACAEAMIMLRGITRKSKVLYSAGLHPEYVETLKTYARFTNITLVEVPLLQDGRTDLAAASANIADAAGMLLQSPNFFGIIENVAPAADLLHEHKALLVSVVNPTSLGLLKRPGDAGADIAVGEGQPLGLPLSAGGPYLGFMATSQKYVRNLPGRIVGETADAENTRAYVLTLQAREQHIRREKAASNICSNQSLCALTAGIYLAAMGPVGMREVAELCLQKAHYLAEGIARIRGMRLRYSAPFFHEFVVDCEKDSALLNAKLKKAGFIGGLRLGRYFPGDNGILYCATEMNTRAEIDAFLEALEVSV